MKSKNILFYFLITLFPTFLYGQSFLLLSSDSTFYPISYRVHILEDKSKKIDIDEILKPESQQLFALPPKGNMNHGFTNSNYWFKLKVTADKSAFDKEIWLIQMKNPNIDTLITYIFDSKNQLIKTYITGDVFNFEERPITYHKFLFPLPLEHADSLTIYIKTAGYYAKEHNFGLITETQVLIDAQYSLGLAIFLIAILFALMAYNFLLYVSIRDITYFHYVAYLLSIMLYLVAVSGIGFQFVYPKLPVVASVLANFSNICAIIFAMLFSLHFLKVKEVLPSWVSKFINGFVFYNVVLLIFLLTTIWYKSLLVIWFKFLIVALLVGVISILALGFWSFKRGVRPARFFLLAWSMLLLSVVVGVLKLLGVLTNVSIDTTVQIGTVLEALFLSFGLADRIKLMEKEKQLAQALAIETLQKNEKIIQEQNIVLEQRVQERTLELADAYHDLEATNSNLNQTNEELQITIELVNEQKELIEAKNTKITDSIRYAQRIQNAILPTLDEIKTELSEVFVFFKPKDIVSGDFYYFNHVLDKTIIAAVDCTGHGVPGAFMSMIGYEILGEITNIKKVSQANEILYQLNLGIRKSLKQDETHNQDGMDIALCVIDKMAKKVEYAGAKNPMLFIQNGELQELKADKIPIGGNYKDNEERFFTNNIIPLADTPTTFYLFTDGYQDQFGGDEGRKFGLKRMRALFSEIYMQDLGIQQHILDNTMIEWRRTERQIDDVLVIGFRI